jgi:ParB family transcriptional regulator, chromosome partitioning protein
MTKKGISFAAVDEGNCTADLDLVLAPADIHPMELAVAQIDPNPYQARKTFDVAELTEGIALHGFLTRLRVRPHPTDSGRFQLVYGERRLRAAIQAGLTTIPCDVIEADDRRMKEDGLMENLHHHDLDPLDEARAFRAMIKDDGYSIRSLSERLGMGKGYVENRLGLLKQPEDVQAMVSARADTVKTAHLIGSLPAEQRAPLIKQVVEDKLPFQEVKRVVEQRRSQPLTGNVIAPLMAPGGSYKNRAIEIAPEMRMVERIFQRWGEQVVEGSIDGNEVNAAVQQLIGKANRLLGHLAEQRSRPLTKEGATHE